MEMCCANLHVARSGAESERRFNGYWRYVLNRALWIDVSRSPFVHRSVIAA